MSLRLSLNFTLAELTASATAKAHGIDQVPPLDVIANLKRLADALETVRRILGGVPLKIHSGYRSPALNAKVGGSPNSYHMIGCAADFDAPAGMTNDTAQHLIAGLPDNPFDLILEEKAKDGANWIHAQIAKPGAVPRKLVRDAELERQGGAITRTTAG